MKKFFTKIYNNYIKKFILLLMIEALLLSSFPVIAYAKDEPKFNIGNFSLTHQIKDWIYSKLFTSHIDYDELPLVLSYNIDKIKKLIYLSWSEDFDDSPNKHKNDDRYFLFKKIGVDGEYSLVTAKEGLKVNYYVDSLDDNIDSFYIVCKLPHLPMMPKHYDLFKYINMKHFFEGLKYRKIMHIVSNEVKIDENDGVSPFCPSLIDYRTSKHSTYLSWKTRDTDIKEYLVFRRSRTFSYYKFTTSTSFEDRNVPHNFDKSYFIWAFDKNGNASVPMIFSKDQSISNVFLVNEKQTTVIQSKGVKIEIPAGSTPAGSFISIIPLDIAHLYTLNGGSINITKDPTNNATIGYEITLNGSASNMFAKDIKISFTYDESRIPYGMKEKMVVSNYFDESFGKWMSLKRENLDKAGNILTSSTNHFCQFYTGLMNIQNEPPQAKGINTKPINIQAVDPLAGITTIAPPTPNNQGSANIGYPVSVPEGINGLTPKVSINYSSDAKDGDCGFGWNLGTSKIERDTKKGVPKYNNSDRLYLDGAEIIPVGDNVYRYKVEGSFSKIVKESDGFVVSQVDGTRMFYGQYNNSNLGNFRWYLSRVEDKFGNQMNYYYMTNGGNRYLQKITYGYNDVYSVNFEWAGRSDERESYMSKFLIRSDLRLKNIMIKYKENELKRYELIYGSTGTETVRKSLLNNIKEIVNGVTINDNSFNYNSWGGGWDNKEPLGISNGIPNFITDNNGVTNIEIYKVYRESDFSSSDEYWSVISDYRRTRNYNFDLNGDSKNEVLKVTEDYFGEVYGVEPLYNLDLYGRNAYKTEPIYEHGELTRRLSLMIFNLVDINGDGIPEGPHFTYEYPDLNLDGLVDQVLGNRYAINDGNVKIEDTEVIDNILRVEDEEDLFGDRHDLNGSGYGGDLDGDGLPEYINEPKITVWVPDDDSGGETHNGSVTVDYTIQKYYDLNGDGLRDKINLSGSQTVWGADEWITVDISKSHFGECAVSVNYNQTNPYRALLNKITNNKTGVSTILGYGANGAGKHRRNVLTKITTYNNDLSFSTNISYSGYTHDYIEKEFRGFSKVTVTTKDMDKNIDHVTETIYRVSDNSGTDKYGNIKYDPYLKGLVDSQITKINGITKSKIKNQYEKIKVLNSNTSVYFTNLKESRVWIYNDIGEFIGVNKNEGDLSSETIFGDGDIDTVNGLIKKSTSIAYGDPYHSNDDVRSITGNFIDVDKWLCLPTTSEAFGKDDKKISGKSIEYYDNGSVKKEIVWNNQENGAFPITEYGYDEIGNVNEIRVYTDKNLTALITKIETLYIADDNYYSQVTATSPDGLKTITKFDTYGRGLETTDIYGDTSIMTLDEYGRVISIQEIVNEIPTITKMFTYSKEGDFFKVEASYLDNIGPDNYIKMQFYKDGFGRNVETKKESIVNGIKCWVVSGYLERDKMGRAIEQGLPTIVSFDESGYVNNKEESLNTKITFEYDDFGRFYKATMPNTYWVTKEYDVIRDDYFNTITNQIESRIVLKNKLTDVENRESIEYIDLNKAVVRTEVKKDSTYLTTKFEYSINGYGKVIESTGAVGEKQFNSLGGLMWMKSPDAGRFEYVYNDKLLVTSVNDYGKTDDGVTRVINYQYDNLNRMIDIKYPGFGSNDTHYDYYDNTGEGNRYARNCIKKISKGDYFEVEYLYEQLSIEVKKRIEVATYNTKFTYDVQGRIDNVIYPDSEKITYAYDEGGYLKSIIGSQEYISSILYNEYGQRTYLRYGNGVETNYTYTKETGLLDTMKQFNGANELLNYDYDFDLTGNLKKLSDTPNGADISLQEYEYDSLGRISSSIGTYKSGEKSYNEAYVFDSDNRILEKTFTRDNGVETKYKFNYQSTDHAIRSIDIIGSASGEKSVEFNYDDFGNMTKKTLTLDTGTSITEYKYDETNKLIGIMLPDNNKQLEFKYDNGGQRIVKEFKDNAGTITKNVYVNGFYELANGLINKHISDGQYIFATKLDNKDENILYYTQNNIGSTTLLTNKEGKDIGQFLYTPFGEMWVEEASTVDISHITRFFTNQQYDKESGLYYYNARYYDPHLGSFITPDPAMEDLNHYAYASANPIKYTDPTGLGFKDTTISDDDNKNLENSDDDSGNNNSESNWDKFVEKCKQISENVKNYWKEYRESTRKEIEKQYQHDRDLIRPLIEVMIKQRDKIDEKHKDFNKKVEEAITEFEKLNLSLSAAFTILQLKYGADLKAELAEKANKTSIGKLNDLKKLGPDEKTLLKHLSDKGSPKLNWEQNSRVLRTEMNKGLPIRDVSVNPNTGDLIRYPGSFLEMERNLLSNHGWYYVPETNLWMPPKL